MHMKGHLGRHLRAFQGVWLGTIKHASEGATRVYQGTGNLKDCSKVHASGGTSQGI
jgi:hypothetical protein